MGEQGGALDGFREDHKEAFTAFAPHVAATFHAITLRIGRALRVTYEGLEHVPREGAALIVANHSFGWDVVLPMGEIWRRHGRDVFALGEHAWWRVPWLRRLAAEVGTVDGTPANLELLLSRGALVLVLPGGLREAVKPRELRYRLLWGHRYGFVRAAIRHQVPLVPLACIGADDLFDFVGNAYRRGERWLRRRNIPIPLPSRVLPIPHLVPLRFVFGEPVVPAVPADREADPAACRRLRREIEGALHELIEAELARRAGIPI